MIKITKMLEFLLLVFLNKNKISVKYFGVYFDK